MRGLAAAAVLLLVTGFDGPAVPQFRSPETTGLVVYLHSSLPEDEADLCAPHDPDSPGGMPLVIKNLHGASAGRREISIYPFCGSRRPGTFDGNTGEGQPKIEMRRQEVEEYLELVRAANGPKLRLFLSGHSAGGWTALLVARRGEVLLDGVIALAPAFAGPRTDRTDAWQALRDRQADLLSSAKAMNALVYAFEGDAYEPPGDLAFFRRIEGVDFRALSPHEIDGQRCRPARPHNTASLHCFEKTQRDAILEFLGR